MFENGAEEDMWTEEGRNNEQLEELRNFYSLPSIRKMRRAEHVARVRRRCIKNFNGNAEG
jgi:hypothetical protein